MYWDRICVGCVDYVLVQNLCRPGRKKCVGTICVDYVLVRNLCRLGRKKCVGCSLRVDYVLILKLCSPGTR